MYFTCNGFTNSFLLKRLLCDQRQLLVTVIAKYNLYCIN